MSNKQHTAEKWVYQSSQVISYDLQGCPYVILSQTTCKAMGEQVAKKMVKDHNAMKDVKDPEGFMKEIKEYLLVIQKVPPEGNDLETHYRHDRLMAQKALALFPKDKGGN